MSIDDAIRHHQAGRLRDAERLYRSMLDAEPHHPDAVHSRVSDCRSGRWDGAQAEIVGVFQLQSDFLPAEAPTMHAVERSAFLEASNQGITNARIGDLILSNELHWRDGESQQEQIGAAYYRAASPHCHSRTAGARSAVIEFFLALNDARSSHQRES